MSKLKAGDKAPLFQANLVSGAPFSLESLKGQKIWLCFYRYANCPLCSHHIGAVMRSADLLRKNGITVVAVFESRPEKFHKHWRAPGQTPCPFVSDPDRKVYQLYGVERSWRKVLKPSVLAATVNALLHGYRQPIPDTQLTTVPAHFLIRRDGTIHTAYYGQSIADHMPWELIKPFLQDL